MHTLSKLLYIALILELSVIYVTPIAYRNFTTPTIQTEVRPYVMTFLERCLQYNEKNCATEILKYTIVIEELHKPILLRPFTTYVNHVVGLCEPDYKRITLVSAYWNIATKSEREQLVAHELAHCILGKDHDDDTHSIMYPSVLDARIYENNYQEAYNKLFDCQIDCPVVTFEQEMYQ